MPFSIMTKPLRNINKHDYVYACLRAVLISSHLMRKALELKSWLSSLMRPNRRVFDIFFRIGGSLLTIQFINQPSRFAARIKIWIIFYQCMIRNIQRYEAQHINSLKPAKRVCIGQSLCYTLFIFFLSRSILEIKAIGIKTAFVRYFQGKQFNHKNYHPWIYTLKQVWK